MLGDEETRQVVRGGFILSDLEAEMLADDPDLRRRLVQLHELMEEWSLTTDMAVLHGTDEPSTYHDVRAQVLNLVRTISEEFPR